MLCYAMLSSRSLHVRHDLTRNGPLTPGAAVPLDVPLHLLRDGGGEASSVGDQVAAAAGRPLVLVAGSWS